MVREPTRRTLRRQGVTYSASRRDLSGILVPMGRAQAGKCQRSISAQWADQSGAIRRSDHPRASLERIDLLTDDALDSYRRAYPEQSEAALEAHELLLTALATRMAEVDAAAVAALQSRTRERPILAVVVCVSCGAFEVSRGSRRWDVDRAMRRTGIAERDLMRVAMVLAEAWAEVPEAPPDLDALRSHQIRELLELAGADVDHVTLRDQYGGERRSPV